MDATDITRVQTYLRRLFGTERINLIRPARAGLSVEVAVEDEVIGTLHRDAEDGEVSYALHLTILEEDLPPLPKTAAKPASPAAPRRR